MFAVASMVLSALNSGAAMAAETSRSQQLDWSLPAMYSLGHCVSPSDLDCIASVGIVDETNQYWPGSFTSESFSVMPDDSRGNKQDLGETRWTIPVGQKNVTAQITSNAETPTHACCVLGNGQMKRFGAIRTYIQVPDPLETKVRMTLRTSWIQPMNVPLYAAEANISEQKIPNGRLWTFEGKGAITHGYNSDFGAKLAANANADWDSTAFYFIIDHAGASDELSAYPKTCSEFGYTAEASNASAAGMPFWDEASKSLNFGISAPHASKAGLPNIGFFKFWATDAYLNCKWPGNSISKSTNVTVQVLNEDGSAQVALTTVSHKDGKLYVSASGFHYSSPTIKVIAQIAATKQPVAVKTPAKPKLSTITCINKNKPRITKKVTAVSPRCPSGYVVKK